LIICKKEWNTYRKGYGGLYFNPGDFTGLGKRGSELEINIVIKAYRTIPAGLLKLKKKL
jgi:hypothetical protein